MAKAYTNLLNIYLKVLFFSSASTFLYAVYHFKRKKQQYDNTNILRSALSLPNSPVDPRWHAEPCLVHVHSNNNEQASGFFRVRSKTFVGAEAALTRWTESESLAMSMQQNAIPQSISLIESMQRFIMLVLVRFPRAIRQWQLWISAASAGLLYFFKSGHLSPQQQQQGANSLQQLFDSQQLLQSKAYKIKTNAKWQDNNKLVQDLQQRYEQKIKKGSAMQY